jgi:hypothetical protein
VFGLDERVVEAARQPRVLTRQLFLHDQGVHDREDSGLLVVGALHASEVREEPRHALAVRRGPARAHVGVELARRHHVAEISARRDPLVRHVRRKRHVHFLDLRALAALVPADVLRRDAVLLLEHPADPHRGGHVVFGHAHALADQIARRLDPGVRSHEHRRVAEAERRKDRDGDQWLAAAPEHRIGRQRKLGDVELAEPSHPVEHLLRSQGHHVQLDAVGLDLASPDGARAVVVAARERELEPGHPGYRAAALAASTTADV